jgi:hypothetical protein
MEFARLVRAQGMEPGLVTHNPVAAADVLGPDLDAFAAIVAPCNEKGYKMVPDRESVEARLRQEPGRFWASHIIAAGRIPLTEGLHKARALGLGGAILSDVAINASGRLD